MIVIVNTVIVNSKHRTKRKKKEVQKKNIIAAIYWLLKIQILEIED